MKESLYEFCQYFFPLLVSFHPASLSPNIHPSIHPSILKSAPSDLLLRSPGWQIDCVELIEKGASGEKHCSCSPLFKCKAEALSSHTYTSRLLVCWPTLRGKHMQTHRSWRAGKSSVLIISFSVGYKVGSGRNRFLNRMTGNGSRFGQHFMQSDVKKVKKNTLKRAC